MSDDKKKKQQPKPQPKTTSNEPKPIARRRAYSSIGDNKIGQENLQKSFVHTDPIVGKPKK